MEFKSIEDIKEYFGFEATEIDEIRKQLINMLAKLHPDKNGGQYINKKQEKDYEEVSNAKDFIDNQNTNFALTRKDLTNFLQKIEDAYIIKTKNDLITEDEISKQLDTSINTSVIKFQKKHFSYKISSLVITSVITTLWLFPSIVERHKILKMWINFEHLSFTIIWFTCLILTSLIWIYAKSLENKDDLIKKSYNLESTQNAIFKLFLAWLHSTYPNSVDYNTETYKPSYRFTKDDMIDFVLNYYQSFDNEFNTHLRDKDLYLKVDEFLKKKNVSVTDFSKKEKKRYYLFLVFKEPGEIDIELAEKITNVIFCKLLSKKMIILSDKKAFSQSYTYYSE
ncbi:hypothetical protein [Pedobacter sp. R-06]|uniref:hypothetical protein n=1 Tax=Pedobacter sp. R-06 TaxID=3404051 RepID=UPI003CF32B08